MARSLKFTVDREPIDLELGGEQFTAPAVLAPVQLAELLDMHANMGTVFSKLTAATATSDVESGVLREALEFIARIFDTIFGVNDDGTPTDSAVRFRARLFSPSHSFDLTREIVPAVTALVEEYSGGRPTPPSSPSSMLPGGDGTSSTAGLPPTGLPHLTSALTASAT